MTAASSCCGSRPRARSNAASVSVDVAAGEQVVEAHLAQLVGVVPGDPLARRVGRGEATGEVDGEHRARVELEQRPVPLGGHGQGALRPVELARLPQPVQVAPPGDQGESQEPGEEQHQQLAEARGLVASGPAEQRDAQVVVQREIEAPQADDHQDEQLAPGDRLARRRRRRAARDRGVRTGRLQAPSDDLWPIPRPSGKHAASCPDSGGLSRWAARSGSPIGAPSLVEDAHPARTHEQARR